MGVAIWGQIPRRKIGLEDLAGQTIVLGRELRKRCKGFEPHSTLRRASARALLVPSIAGATPP